MRCAMTEKKTVTPRRSAGVISGGAVSACNAVSVRLDDFLDRITCTSGEWQV